MIYKNLLIILSQLFLLVNRIVYGQFIPGPRIGHTANYVENKTYYIGGTDYYDIDATESNIFYLDNGIELTITGLLKWVESKSQGTKLPLTRWHTSNIGGTNQDLIFIIGGNQSDITNLVYQFDTKTNLLSVPKIQGTTPPRRRDMNSVSYEGKIYMFGGRSISNSNEDLIFNNFDILNTVTMNWEVGSLINAPLPGFMYTATLVNGIIYYIGGLQKSGASQNYVQMNNIYQYDIASSTWSLKNATATRNMPGPRYSHSAVLFDNKICIFGGGYHNFNMPKIVSPVEPIAVLNTIDLIWTVPELENINTPKLEDNGILTLVYHTATLLQNNFMIIVFGNITDSQKSNNNVYVFNLNQPKFQWFRLENPKIPTTLGTPTTTPSDINDLPSYKPVVIGLSVGIAVLGVVAFVIYSVFYGRKNQDQVRDFIETPDNNNYRFFPPI